MSIRIDREKCVGCSLCMEACPGNLIKKDCDGKACIKNVKDCWGCTSCIKECKRKAIEFYLGADMGGKGSTLTVSEQDNISTWQLKTPSGETKTIEVNKKDANKY